MRNQHSEPLSVSHNSPRSLEGRPTCNNRWNGGYRKTTTCHIAPQETRVNEPSSSTYQIVPQTLTSQVPPVGHEIFSPQLDLAPLSQLSRISRIPKRLPQPSFVSSFPVSSWTSGIGRRRIRVGIRTLLPTTSTEVRTEVDQIHLFLRRRVHSQRLVVQERRLSQQVLGIEGREERFEEFHLGELSFEGVPEEDGKVFRRREEGSELEDLRRSQEFQREDKNGRQSSYPDRIG
jgi:hypothetical protein